MRAPVRVGVLALQGDFAAHVRQLERRGIDTVLIRGRRHLENLDGLVLPGGESSVMLRLLGIEALAEPLRATIASGIPTLATCAGMILLAHSVTDPVQTSLDLLDVDVSRNGYGRQLHSGTHTLRGAGGFPDCRGIFIRAPRVTRAGERCEILATLGQDPVLVRQESILAACFHPEFDDAHPLYDLFTSASGLVPHDPSSQGRRIQTGIRRDIQHTIESNIDLS